MEVKTWAQRAGAGLDKFFFAEERSLKLGLLRVALVLACLDANRRYYPVGGFAFVTPALAHIQKPSLLMQLLGVPFPLAKAGVAVFAGVYYAAAFCALVGVLTRPALLVYGLLSLYLFDIMASRGVFNHEASLANQVLLVLACAPGTTRLSLSGAVRWAVRKTARRDLRSFYRALLGPPAPVWGAKTILILLACTYCTSGFSKIRYGGLQWLDGRTLTYYLDGRARTRGGQHTPMFIGPREVPAAAKWKDGYGIYSYSYGNRQGRKGSLALGEALASNATAMAVLSTGTVLFELCGFVLLLGGWPRVLYLLGAIAMHKTIGVLMDLPFIEYQVILFFSVDWRWVYQRLPLGARRKLGAGPPREAPRSLG